MTATATTRTGTWLRVRALVLATVLAITGFGFGASPVEVPRPAELQPAPVLAYACADGPAFEGYLTNSTSSHPMITTSPGGDVYAWISQVVDDWGCTAFYRYDGIAWARSATRGNFAWGNLINSTSVSCSWVVNSTDYVKANSTNDCPDSDAEYAYLIHLGDTGGGTLMEGTFQNAGTPNARGEFAFIHSDCESYYGASPERWDQAFGTGTGPRPGGGSNCDPYDFDGTNNDQVIDVGSGPTGSVSINGGAAYSTSSTVSLTLSASDPSTVSQMRFSNTGNGTDWQTFTYATTKAGWTLASGEGTRTVYAQFMDPYNHWGPTTPATDTIVVDTTPAFPSPPAVSCAPVAGAVYQSASNGTCYFRPQAASSIALTATATDGVSGILHVRFENPTLASTWTPTPALPNQDTTSPYQEALGFTAATGSATIGVTARNGAELDGATRTVSLTPDTTPPTATITLPEVNRAVSGAVTVTGVASDTQTFKDYKLEYGAGATPTSWPTIGTYTSAVSGGTLATWSPGSLSGIYTIRLTVTDQVGNSSQATRTVVLENGLRGDEAYLTRVPYDLGGDWRLDVGVANGEARLARDLFSIPSYGPAQALSLTYSSSESGAAGRFGVGWSSNLTQYLTFESANAVTTWHRADGGREPFGLVAGTWTPPRGHYETMTVAGSEATITTADQTRYVFESSGAGRLMRIENRFSKALTLVWNATSATATDASGRATTITIDSAHNRISGVADSAGRSWTFAYAGAGASSDLTCVTDPASRVTRLTYAAHALTRISRGGATCGADGTTNWSAGYVSGKAASVTSPEVASPDLFTYSATTTTWHEVYNATPATADTVYTLDTEGRGWVTSTGSPEGALTARTFDSDGNLLTETTPDDGGVVATYQYDLRGNVTRQERVLERAEGVNPPLIAVTRWTYNATDDVLTRTDADNDATTRTVTKDTYDAAGHRTSENRNCTSTGTTIPLEGQGGTCTGAGTQNASTNVITNYAYTSSDQLEYEQDPRGFVTKHIYDTYGNETAVIADCTSSGTTLPSPFASCTTTTASNGGTHDAATNVLTTSAYDQGTTAGKAGLPTSSTDALVRTSTYTYDSLGRQTREILPGDTSTIPVLTRDLTYDEYGNTLTEAESWTPIGDTQAVTRTTTHTYDKEHRETSVVDPTGTARTTTAYDPQGNQVEQVVKNVAGTITATTTQWSYDLDGNQTAEVLVGTSGPATLQTATYTPSRLLRTATTGTTTQQATLEVGGAATTVETFAVGNPTPLSSTTTTYDTLGSVTATTSEIGTVTASTYDRLGRLLTSTVAGRTTTSTYDRSGNQLTVTDPAGITTTTTYDALDRATTVVVNDVASPTLPSEDVTTTTYFDAAGNTVATRDARGITTRSIQNARDQVAETIANCTDSGTTPSANPAACTGGGTHSTTVNVVTDTTYDGQGNAVKTVTAVGLTSPVLYQATTETAYDAAGRVQASKDALGTLTRNRYNEAGQLTDTYVNCTTSGTTIPTDWAACTGAGTADGTYNIHTHYAYDAWGNQAIVTAPNGRETRSLYDTSNRLVGTIDNYANGVAETTDGSLVDDVTMNYVYDDAGRQAVTWTRNADGTRRSGTVTMYNDDGSVAQVIVNCTTTGTTAPATDAAALACTGAGTKNADTNLVTTNTYDARGRLVAVTAPDPSATSGGSTASVTTQYAYDAAGHLCRVVEHTTANTNLLTLANPCTSATQDAGTATANTSTRYTYDGASNLVSMTDAAGHTTSYTYDAAGHPTGRTDPLGVSLVWTYDDIGNRTGQRNRTDAPPTLSVTWTHDPAGRILTRVADSTTTTYTYDQNGNRLTAAASGMTITATFDRLGRVLTVDDEDAGSTPDTTYMYSLTSPTWSDPTGSYAATLDRFDRAVSLTDPVSASAWTTTYGTGGQVLSGTQGNGNTVSATFDATGRELTRTTKTGASTRAAYTWTYNRAGLALTEASTITGDPSSGTIAYLYDELGRLKSSNPGTTTAYTWDAATNRTGAGTSTTAFDAANRPTSGTSPTAAYASDADGRLTGRPGQTLAYDHLGRLTGVKDAAGVVTLATYTYDPLDRLRTADHGAAGRTRFRYTGLTTAAAQLIDDLTGTVTRSIANGWGAEHLADWDPASGASSLRVYGTNAHHDTTWLADTTGAVIAALRYDPWGVPRSTPSAGYTPFRFQGSWQDSAVDLAWVVTRWYAPALGTFITEDSLLGEPRDPDSRHLYAYGEGEPVGSWDPEGREGFGPCGGVGCVAGDSGATRIRQLTRFFTLYPGYKLRKRCVDVFCDSIEERRIALSDTGYGEAILQFMRWENESGRIAGWSHSPWWDRANKHITQSILTAWSRFERGDLPPARSSMGVKSWYDYLVPLSYASWATKYRIHNGGSRRRFWKAHQDSLWNGVTAAKSSYPQESLAEQWVIYKVLSNVEWYFETTLDADGALGLAIKIGNYPDYPPTRAQACSMWWMKSGSVTAKLYVKPAPIRCPGLPPFGLPYTLEP